MVEESREDRRVQPQAKLRAMDLTELGQQRIHAERGPFHIIIDDGSHRPEHIRDSFGVLFPLLEDGGIYAIEDTQTSYWPEWGGSEDLHDLSTSMNLVKDLIDGLNYEEFVDEGYEPSYTDLNIVGVHAHHNLVFLRKGPNASRAPIGDESSSDAMKTLDRA